MGGRSLRLAYELIRPSRDVTGGSCFFALFHDRSRRYNKKNSCVHEMMKKFDLKFSITNQITDGLTKIERARGFLEATALSEDWIRQMGERALVLEAHYTTHIEGTRLSLNQSERILAGKEVAEADPDDVRELLNYRTAFEFVSDYLNTGGPITEGLIREIHKRLVAGVRGGEGQPEEYRRVQNYIINSITREVIYTPPPPEVVPALMAGLVGWLNEEREIHPILISGISQFQLVHIHPFVDGNGRTSRLLSTLCLYRAGYDFKRLFTISEFYDRDRSAFYKTIQSVRERDMDMTGWLEYFVSGLIAQMEEVKEKGEKAIRCDMSVKKFKLNERQARALSFLLDHGKLTIQDYETLVSDVNRRTLQRDLKGMVDRGLLLTKGATNNQIYMLKENI